MFAQSYPPADNLIQQLSTIEYKKHLNTFMDIIETIVLYVSAVSYVIYQKVSQWYQNGGKDSTIQLIQKIRNFLEVCYLWIRCEGYPGMMQFFQDVQQTYRAWMHLVTV